MPPFKYPTPTAKQKANLKKAEEEGKKANSSTAAKMKEKFVAPSGVYKGASAGWGRDGQIQTAKNNLITQAGTMNKTQAEINADKEKTKAEEAAKAEAKAKGMAFDQAAFDASFKPSNPNFTPVAEKKAKLLKAAEGIGQNPTAPTNDPNNNFTLQYEKARKEAEANGQKLTLDQFKASKEGQDIMASEQYKKALAKNQALKVTNQKKNAASAIGAPPAPPEFTGNETPEEKSQMQLDYQTQLTEYEQQKNEALNQELGTVSDKVGTLEQKVADFKMANQESIGQLNQLVSGLGDRIAQMAGGIDGNVDINNPDIQAKIKEVASDPNLTTEQQNQKISDILKQSGATASDPALPTGMNVGEQKTPVNNSNMNAPEPELSPEEIEANGIKNDIGNFYAKPKENLTSIIDYLSSIDSDGSDFTSADLSLMQLKSTTFAIDKSSEKLKANYEQRKSRIMKDMEFYKDYFENKRQEGVTRLENAEARQQRRLELQEQQILADKADTKADLAKKTERYESFAKAQMFKMGVPVEGQAGMTMLFNAMANWNDSVAAQVGQYDDKLQVIHDKQIEIAEVYLDKIFEFTNSIDEKELAQMDKFNAKWDEIDKDELLDERQSELLKIQALGTFFEDKKVTKRAEEEAVRQEKMAEKQAMIKLMEAQEQRMWDVQLEGIKASGGVPTIGPDGKPTLLLDENGNMVKNSTQMMNEFEIQKFYAQMSQMELHQDSETGEWIGYNKSTGQMVNYGKNDPMSGVAMGGFDMGSYMQGETIDLGGGKSVTIGSTYGPGQGNQAECVGGARYLNPNLPKGLWTIDDKLGISNDPVNAAINGQQSVPPQVGSTVFLAYGKIGHAATVTALYQENGIKYMDYIDVNGDGKSNKWGQKTRVPVSSAKGFWTDTSGAQVIKPKVQGPVQLNKKQQDNATTLRKEFNDLQSVKDFKLVKDKASNVKSIIESGVGGPADLALVYEFMKALDPTSVVRETEFDSAAKSGNIFTGYAAKFNGYLKADGGFLPENVKNGFLTIVEQALKTKTKAFNEDYDRYSRIAKDNYGLPIESVVENYAEQANMLFGGGPQTGPEQQEMAAMKNRQAIIDEIKQSPDTSLQALLTEIADTPWEQKEVEKQFEKYFGSQWKKYTIGKVNAVNIADIILSLN